MTRDDWSTDDMLIEFARGTTYAQRLQWLEAALDFAYAAGALEKTRKLEEESENTRAVGADRQKA